MELCEEENFWESYSSHRVLHFRGNSLWSPWHKQHECFREILLAAIINIDISQGHVSSEQRLGIQILVDYLQNGYLCLLIQQSNNMDMSNLDVQLEKEIWTHLQGFISTLFPFPDTKLLKNGAVGII